INSLLFGDHLSRTSLHIQLSSLRTAGCGSNHDKHLSILDSFHTQNSPSHRHHPAWPSHLKIVRSNRVHHRPGCRDEQTCPEHQDQYTTLARTMDEGHWPHHS